MPGPAWLAELWSSSVAAASDRHTMHALGVPSALLMERAALAVASETMAFLAGQRLPVRVLCGGGNNGADGVAVARILSGWGLPAEAIVVASKPNPQVVEQVTWARAHGVSVTQGWNPDSYRGSCLWIDGLLGTGTSGVPRGAVAEVLAGLSGDRNPKIAIDIPSGVDPDRGAVRGACLLAHLTITFGRSKPGLHITPGRNHAGRVVVADIGLVAPPDWTCDTRLIDPSDVTNWRSTRRVRHKGDRGHVGVIGGSRGTAGAVVLAATAALRAGAGLVTIASGDPDVQRDLLSVRPELMLATHEDPSISKADALVIGPGLTDEAHQSAIRHFWTEDPRPSVWDASMLVHIPEGRPGGPRIVTPHPGEAAAMLAREDPSWTSTRVQSDRVEAIRALVRRTSAVVVLKGEASLVATAAGDLAICTTGDETLATAGSGDCLAGILGTLLAQGVEAPKAARMGTHVHGVAGERAGRSYPGALALDIANAIGEAMVTDHGSKAWPRWRSG